MSELRQSADDCAGLRGNTGAVSGVRRGGVRQRRRRRRDRPFDATVDVASCRSVGSSTRRSCRPGGPSATARVEFRQANAAETDPGRMNVDASAVFSARKQERKRHAQCAPGLHGRAIGGSAGFGCVPGCGVKLPVSVDRCWPIDPGTESPRRRWRGMQRGRDPPASVFCLLQDPRRDRGEFRFAAHRGGTEEFPNCYPFCRAVPRLCCSR